MSIGLLAPLHGRVLPARHLRSLASDENKTSHTDHAQGSAIPVGVLLCYKKMCSTCLGRCKGRSRAAATGPQLPLHMEAGVGAYRSKQPTLEREKSKKRNCFKYVYLAMHRARRAPPSGGPRTKHGQASKAEWSHLIKTFSVI
jgi:hypothetical protein